MINLIMVDGTTVARPLVRAWEKGNQIDNINVGDRFNYNNEWGWFIAKPDQPVKWGQLMGFEFVLHDNDEWRFNGLAINGFHAGGKIELLKMTTEITYWFPLNGSSNTVTYIKPPAPPPAPIPPIRTPEKQLNQEEVQAIEKLIIHFVNHKEYYSRVIQLNTDPNTIAVAFEKEPWGPGTMDDHVEPTPLEVFGSYVAYPLAKRLTGVDDTVVVDIAAALNGNDPARRQWAAERLAAMSDADRQSVLERLPLASAKSERLNTMATRGVFAEGKLGHCNVSEEIDNTRFWKWEEHPIPIEAPDINPVTPIQPTPQQVSAVPTAFPQSLVNIVNPSPAPDPAGLTTALSLLGTSNIFRDMSGRQEVADLLKKLSDNSIAIAEAANRAREIQAKYGTDLDKHEKDLKLGQTQANAELVRAMIQQRREKANQVKPNEAQDAIKLSESETRKGNKTPEEHREYSKQLQQNVKGVQPAPKRKSKENIKLQIDLKGWGNNYLVGRFGVNVKQHDSFVGWLEAVDYSAEGHLIVGVLNEWDDNRYHVEVHGEVLGGVGINALLKSGNMVAIPRADFDSYDYFYLEAIALTDTFDFETTKSDEVVSEVAKKIGGSVEGAYKKIITMTAEGGVEWKDGQTHTATTAVKVKVVYYTGGFIIRYSKGE